MDALRDEIIQIIWDTFENIYIDDYDNHEDYTDNVISEILKKVEEVAPHNMKKRLTDTIWSAYHHFDESEFADTESLVDAVINVLVNDIRFFFNNTIKQT